MLNGNWNTLTPWYVKCLAILVRIGKRYSLGQKVIRDFRDFMLWGFVAESHLKYAHCLRDFSINSVEKGVHNLMPGDVRGLANAHRDVMAQLVELNSAKLHCTIKLCNYPMEADKMQCRVYTIARSEPYNRPSEYHPQFYLAGENSAFAALLGCDDRRNKWTPQPYCAFLCNDLKAHSSFDCSREEWDQYYRSTAVFPLQCSDGMNDEKHVMGFLTFDSLDVGAFGKMPDIFAFSKSQRDTYKEQLLKSAFVQTGGLLADSMSAVLLMIIKKEKKDNES